MQDDSGSLRRSEITRKLEEKQALRPCDACGHQRWLVPHQDEPDKGMVLSMLLGQGLGHVISFTPAICNNCGNTRVFHVETLMGDAK